MAIETGEIIHLLIDNISKIKEVEAIGISGDKTLLPKAGEGDIDIFIYCDTVPPSEKRKNIINNLSNLLKESKIDILKDEHWGIGDFVNINDIETWIMYFSTHKTLNDIEAILNGDFPDKLDNYYYPTGLCAMLKNINILYDKNNFLYSLRKKLSSYPDKLSKLLTKYHLNKLNDTEDLERAVNRKDVLFYHFAIDIAIDHFLQALFAINKTYFPSRKRTVNFIENFHIKPEKCNEKLLEIVKLGGYSESINQSYILLKNIIDELKKIQ